MLSICVTTDQRRNEAEEEGEAFVAIEFNNSLFIEHGVSLQI